MRTSGSLGPPKMIRLSYDNMRANAASVAEAHALRASDRLLTSLPLDFSAGLSMVNAAFAAGASVALSDCSPSARPFWEFLDHVDGTCAAAVPATYRFLRDRKWEPAAHPSLRLLIHSGGTPDASALAYYGTQMMAKGGDFVATYGQTEAGRIAYLPGAVASAHPGATGRTIPGVRITIERPSGGSADDGEIGEIVIEGPGVMMGYARIRPELSLGDVQGISLRTRDMGYLRAGLLHVTGRMDRQVKVFGRRINLDQVESEMLARGVPAAVTAVTHERLVVATDGTAEAVARECRALARRLCLPLSAVCGVSVDSLPYTSRGKIDRLALGRGLADSSAREHPQ